MKLLFDQNLSPKLPSLLGDLFPDSVHVSKCGLASADDVAVWNFAKTNDFIIVSKDSDFYYLAELGTGVPKVVWLTLGNCSTVRITRCLRLAVEQIEALVADPEEFVLEIG